MKLPLLVMSSLRCVSCDWSTFPASSAATRASSLLKFSFSLPMFLRASIVSGYCSKLPAFWGRVIPAAVRPVLGGVCCDDPDRTEGTSVAGRESVVVSLEIDCPEMDGELGAAGLPVSSTGWGEEGALVWEGAALTAVKSLLKGVCVGWTTVAGSTTPEFTSSCKKVETC